jgi:hypothetical protein
MISNMNSKRKEVGRGMAKVANQKSAKQVPMNFGGSPAKSAPKAQAVKKASGGDTQGVMRGGGAATKGKSTRGLTGPYDISVKADMKRRLPGD